MITPLPLFLDKTSHFLDKLDEFCRNENEFSLGDLCVNLTFHIIGKSLWVYKRSRL